MKKYCQEHGIVIPDFKDLPTSAIIGSVELDDIQYHEAYPDAFAEDFQYHWFLKNAKLFDEPIRNVKGKLFLWDYEYNESAAASVRLSAASALRPRSRVTNSLNISISLVMNGVHEDCMTDV